jgi:fatty acid desaturase
MRTAAAPPPKAGDVLSFATEDRLTRDLVRDLHEVRPALYWRDLLATCLLGWSGFVFAVVLRPFSLAMLAAAAIAVIALYRGLCFVHEISHQGPRALPGFEVAWNVLIGYPFLLPSFAYAGVHQDHHKLSTYGTRLDPEYLPFARSGKTTVLFALYSFLIPVISSIRFLILSPLAVFLAPFQRWMVVHCSSLTINPAYRREATPELIRCVRHHSMLILVFWSVLAGLAVNRVIPWRFFAVWLGISALISFINTLRTLGAHAYESAGEPIGRSGQLADSIDTPGALWTEIWAPLGLRYHALHHYFSGIPYYNLGEAWSRLSQALPPDALYHKVRSPGLAHSLCALYCKGRRRSG